ncbi:MAG: ribulose phosphate epimerase [Ilumatobacteraceae bacterium]|nr:ribulose phosphate epimerase [Ilumatobacteraceae bacterium]
MTSVADMTDVADRVMDDVATERLRRQNEVVAGYRIFASYGWGDDGSGHISARDPEHTESFWLLRYGVAFAKATVADLVLVGPDGDATSDGGHDARINQAAFCIHAPIHRARPDVVSVAHTHTGYGTPFAAMARTIRATSQEACAFHGDQSVFEGEELDVIDVVVGGRLAAALGPSRLLVLANHGLLTVGATVGQAIGFFVLAERAAEVEIKAGSAARVVSDASAAAVYRSLGEPSNGDTVFGWLRRTRLGEG